MAKETDALHLPSADTDKVLDLEQFEKHTKDSSRNSHQGRSESPRRVLQHRHTTNNFSQQPLSKDEARRRMMSWRKTTKCRKTTAPACPSSSRNHAFMKMTHSSIDNNFQLPDKNSTNLEARKRGNIMGGKKVQSLKELGKTYSNH